MAVYRGVPASGLALPCLQHISSHHTALLLDFDGGMQLAMPTRRTCALPMLITQVKSQAGGISAQKS